MSFLSKFFRDIAIFFKTLRNEFFQLKHPSFYEAFLYLIGVLIMLIFFTIFFAILDAVLSYLLTKFFVFFV